MPTTFSDGDVRSGIPRFTQENRAANQALVDHVSRLAESKAVPASGSISSDPDRNRDMPGRAPTAAVGQALDRGAGGRSGSESEIDQARVGGRSTSSSALTADAAK